MAKRKKILNDTFLMRLSVLVVLMIFFLIILFGRLFQIQVIDRGKYVKKAKRQYSAEAKLTSDRGIIYDRTLEPLAVNRQSFSVGVDVSKVTDVEFAATHFSVIFGKSKAEYLESFKKNKSFFW